MTYSDPDHTYRSYQKPDANPLTFFFYDLETSGLSPREDRIMQFAGQRTDADFNPIGDPVNLLLKLSDDTLPSPHAIMVTKITPQSTQSDGLSEPDFARLLTTNFFTPNTCIVGYNSVRFDDEFIRHLLWRNFYDPYEWQWKDNRSRFDLLDVVRMTRALRPEGITWPFTPEGAATNRLELLTKLNGIAHEHAHDALSDVEALISVTRLIKQKQPGLFNYLFEHRTKKQVQTLVNLDQKKPFVYSSGRYPSEFNKTTVAFPLGPSRHGNLLVFDLRHNLEELFKSPDIRPDFYPIVKEFAPGKCPAIAPLGVLSNFDGWAKIKLTEETVKKNLSVLLSHPDFAERMREQFESRPEFPPSVDPESALYEAFLPDTDRPLCAKVRIASANTLADFHPSFTDERLVPLLLHYKAKNFPSSLSESEAKTWEEYRSARLSRQAPSFLAALKELSVLPNVDHFILEELSLWYQSLSPSDY